jgi:hypothetical protein
LARSAASLRREVNVVFSRLPKCFDLAVADLWKLDEAAYRDLAREAMAEVEAAMRDIWKDVRRGPWFRRRPVIETYAAGETQATE